MNQVTYTDCPDPRIPASITIDQPAPDPKDDLGEIRIELASMKKDDARLELLLMVPELAKEKTPEQLQQMREKAMIEAGQEPPMVAALVALFMDTAISHSVELAEKKSSRQDPREESLPAAMSDKITPEQDDSISSGQ